jgi:hypothetical protein
MAIYHMLISIQYLPFYNYKLILLIQKSNFPLFCTFQPMLIDEFGENFSHRDVYLLDL